MKPIGLAGLAFAFVVQPLQGLAAPDTTAPAAASFAYSLSHPVTPLPNEAMDAVADRADAALGIVGAAGADKLLDPRDGLPRKLSQQALCGTIATVARGYGLPIPFFANLIWQESNFKLDDISRAGAQGIAQFMPRTALDFGLINPFEPVHALNAAAKFLRQLAAHFGNLGLAAMAYNAGMGRVSNWIANRGALPSETRNYVLRITGRPADRWTDADAKNNSEFALMPAKAPCPEVAAAVQEEARHGRVAGLIAELVRAIAPSKTKAAEKPSDVSADTAASGRRGSARAALQAHAHAHERRRNRGDDKVVQSRRSERPSREGRRAGSARKRILHYAAR